MVTKLQVCYFFQVGKTKVLSCIIPKMQGFQIAGLLQGCQVARLPSCQAARLPSCNVPNFYGFHIARMPSCKVAKLQGCQFARLLCWNLVNLQVFKVARLPSLKVVKLQGFKLARWPSSQIARAKTILVFCSS